MKKYLKVFIAALIALIFIGTFVFLWQKSRPKEIVYQEFTPEKKDIRMTTILTGKIEPRNEVNVKPQISGIITELLKEPGQTVTAGEVIARVKVIPDMGQLSSAESRVRLSAINLQQAEKDYARQLSLHEQKLVSDEEFEKTRQQLRQAQEEKAAADDALQVVRDGVSRSNASASSTLIRSTIAGVILDIPVKVGNSVINSNTFNDGTTIATVANMRDLIFRGNIDETEVGRMPRWNTSRPRPPRATAPTSLRSRRPSPCPPRATSARAIRPMPRSCLTRPAGCSACPRAPSSSVATPPSSTCLPTPSAREPTPAPPSRRA